MTEPIWVLAWVALGAVAVSLADMLGGSLLATFVLVGLLVLAAAFTRGGEAEPT